MGLSEEASLKIGHLRCNQKMRKIGCAKIDLDKGNRKSKTTTTSEGWKQN